MNRTETLLMSFHVNNIYLHEMALYPDYNAEDFRPPFLVKTTTQAKNNKSVSPAYLDAIMICLSSTHALIAAFLNTSIKTLRVVPIVTYVRMAYAAVVLTKLHFSAVSPSSEIGKFLDRDSLQVSQYLHKLVIHLTAVVGAEKNRMASKFLMILVKLRAWYGQHRMQVHSKMIPDGQLEPCMHIRPHRTEPAGVTASPLQVVALKRQKIVRESETELRGLETPVNGTNSLPQAESDNNYQNDVEIFANDEVELAEMNDSPQRSAKAPPTFETEYLLPHSEFHFSNSIDFSSEDLVLFNGLNPSSDDLDSWVLNARLF